MIKSSRHKGLRRLFEAGDHRGVPPNLAPRIRRRLGYLNAAKKIQDVDWRIITDESSYEVQLQRLFFWALQVLKPDAFDDLRNEDVLDGYRRMLDGEERARWQFNRWRRSPRDELHIVECKGGRVTNK